MCEPNSGSLPCLTRSTEMSTSGSMNAPSLGSGQWSVCSAMLTSYLSATTPAKAAMASAPATMFFTPWPDQNSAPPVEACTMPSLPASAKPLIAAFSVCEDVTLMAG